MESAALRTFEHAIQDSLELLDHFDNSYQTPPPPPQAEVLKRASLVMAFAALEIYIEDRITEAADVVAGTSKESQRLATFYRASLENELKSFHTPTSDRVKGIFDKYLGIDVTKGWSWDHFKPSQACEELNKIARKRGEVVHRSLRPIAGHPSAHAVTRDDMRKIVRFIQNLVKATDLLIGKELK